MRSNGEKKSISVVRLQMIRQGSLPYGPKEVRSSRDAAGILRSFLDGADREYFVALLFDARNRVHALNVVAIGTLTNAIVHPRELFKLACISNAAAVILGHNHPSGNPSPSPDDMDITRRLAQAGDLMGIKVLDHIILGDREYVSFADKGLLLSTPDEGKKGER